MRDVCRTDCSGSIYQDTGSGGSIYIAVFIYDAGGAAAVPSAEGGASGRGMAAAALCADPAVGRAAEGNGGLMLHV